MNRIVRYALTLPILLLVTFSCATADSTETTEVKLETLDQKAAYAMGLGYGRNIKTQAPDIDVNIIVQGLQDAFTEGDAALTDEELNTVMTEWRGIMQSKQAEQARIQGEKNQSEGDAFLAKNAEREGVTVTESGLQYEVLQAGEGPSPTAAAKATVHYTGKLLDDTVFDSSVERGMPATFPLRQVIPGWTEGVQLMNKGAKYRFFIPSAIAYGKRGAPPKIGPDAALVFDIELISFEEPAAGQ